MKIVIYGDKSLGSGGWSYAQCLTEMGHKIDHMSDPENKGQYRSIPVRLYRRFRRELPAHLRREHVSELKKLVAEARPHIVIVLKGLHLSGEDVRELKARCEWIVNINHDDFFSHNPNNWSKIQREAIPAYDYIFVTRRVNVAEIEERNANVEFFPFAYNPDIHKIIKIAEAERQRFANDLVFIGTWERDRAELLEHLVRQLDVRVEIYGSQWEKLSASSDLIKYVKGQGAYGDEMCKLIGGSNMSLGFLRKENRDQYTQRTFEIPACGGVLLGERTSEHLDIYQEGREAEFFDPTDPGELIDKVRALLADAPRREAMRAAGNAALLRGHHTYHDRMERLFSLFEAR
jgi:spore maturation protein CgeB